MLLGQSPQAGTTPPAQPPAKPPKQNAIVTGGDAGASNTAAAPVPAHCRIKGMMAKGDYDFFTFNHPGGPFRVYSEPGLNLVADLIRASDGKVLVRHGVDTERFLIEGNLDAGRYIIALRVMRHAASGPYQVNLGNPGNCVMQDTR